jgi:hypothetical protein
VSAYDLDAVRPRLKPDAFISTWALTESPAAAQIDVGASNFFGAQRVLMASLHNENNALYGEVQRLGLQRVPVPTAANLGPGNEYWFR